MCPGSPQRQHGEKAPQPIEGETLARQRHAAVPAGAPPWGLHLAAVLQRRQTLPCRRHGVHQQRRGGGAGGRRFRLRHGRGAAPDRDGNQRRRGPSSSPTQRGWWPRWRGWRRRVGGPKAQAHAQKTVGMWPTQPVVPHSNSSRTPQSGVAAPPPVPLPPPADDDAASVPADAWRSASLAALAASRATRRRSLLRRALSRLRSIRAYRTGLATTSGDRGPRRREPPGAPAAEGAPPAVGAPATVAPAAVEAATAAAAA